MISKIAEWIYKIIMLVLVIGIVAWLYTDQDLSSSGNINVPGITTQAIYGTNYSWTDSIAINTTAKDSHFTVQWQQASFWADCAFKFRDGSPDTSSWDSRKWAKVVSGQVTNFGPATKLTRLEFKTVTGTGSFFIKGYKRSAQY